MTSLAVPARNAVVRLAVHADAAAFTALAALSGALAAATWGTWGDLDSDTGYDVVAGALVAQGDLPYRDFVYYYGPLAPALHGLAAWAASPGIGVAVGIGLVVAFAIVAATYALARIVTGPLGAFFAAGITAAVAFIPNNYSYVVPHTGAATLGTLLLLGLLLALWRLGTAGSARWALAAGTALGLLALTKPEPAAAGLLAAAAWLVTRKLDGRRVRRDAILVAAPALALPGLVYGAFLGAVSARTLVLENLYPVDTLNAGGDVLIEGRMPLTAASFAEQGWRLALYGAGAACLVALARLAAAPGRGRRLALALGGAGLVLGAAASVVNPEALRHGLQYVYGWVPAGAALAVVALLLARRRRGTVVSERERLLLAATVALLAAAATAYSGFFLHATRPQMAVYYAPLVAVFLVALHLRWLPRDRAGALVGAAWLAFLVAAGVGLTLKDAGAETVTVAGAQGSLAETPAEAELHAAAASWIERETRPGERILVGPLLTGLYALTGREPALPELSLLPGVLARPGGEAQAIRRLEADPVRLVVTDSKTWPAYGTGSFGEAFGRDLAAWIDHNYDRAARIEASTAEPRALTVWIRR